MVKRGILIVLAAGALLAQQVSVPGFQRRWLRAEYLSSNQTLRRVAMPRAKRAAIRSAILKMDEPFDAEPQTDVLDTRIKFVDLNHDGEPEVIAQGAGNYHCSPTGNCQIWVFRWERDKYALLMEAIGQTLIVEKRVRGYSDIVVRMHGSAFLTGYDVFRYEKGVSPNRLLHGYVGLDGREPKEQAVRARDHGMSHPAQTLDARTWTCNL